MKTPEGPEDPQHVFSIDVYKFTLGLTLTDRHSLEYGSPFLRQR